MQQIKIDMIVINAIPKGILLGLPLVVFIIILQGIKHLLSIYYALIGAGNTRMRESLYPQGAYSGKNRYIKQTTTKEYDRHCCR